MKRVIKSYALKPSRKRTHDGSDENRLIFKAVLVGCLPPFELFQGLGFHFAGLFHIIKHLARVNIVREPQSSGCKWDGSPKSLEMDEGKGVIGDIDHINSGGLRSTTCIIQGTVNYYLFVERF